MLYVKMLMKLIIVFMIQQKMKLRILFYININVKNVQKNCRLNDD